MAKRRRCPSRVDEEAFRGDATTADFEARGSGALHLDGVDFLGIAKAVCFEKPWSSKAAHGGRRRWQGPAESALDVDRETFASARAGGGKGSVE